MKMITVHRLNSIVSKAFGLIGQADLSPVFFNTRWGIHTFFMKHPIDVLILDDSYHVVQLKEGLKPFSIYFWNPKYCHVVELPNGMITQLKIKRGQQLTVVFQK